jgi:hypothetical protein
VIDSGQGVSLELQDRGSRIVIQFPWIVSTIYTGLGCGSLSWMLRAYPPVVWAIPLLFIARSAAEHRRKIILSDDGIEYWPIFGPPRMTRFAEVTAITAGTVGGTFLLEAQLHPGAWLTLVDGERRALPLDLPYSDLVFEEIVRTWELHGGQILGGKQYDSVKQDQAYR